VIRVADLFGASGPTIVEPKEPRKDRTHWLYIMVIAAVILGILMGLFMPDTVKSHNLAILGTYFVNLIKMMISPVIFCTIVLGIGSVAAASSVGKAGGIALGYFLTMSTFALAIGLVVGNLIHPGGGLKVTKGAADQYAKQAEASGDFILNIIPTTMFSAVTSGAVLQTLFVALLVGFALQRMGKQGEPILRGIGHLQKLVFRVLIMVLWVAPIGAFGAIAGVVANTGVEALKQLALLMGGFYLTCVLFIVGVLGTLLFLVARVSIIKLLAYLGREYLLIVATSSSESALPNLMAKMEHVGVHKSTVGIVVPTGYSFNLDGTAIYLTMASLFVANAMGKPFSLPEQIGLLLFMIVASKGAAGVSGAGLATLAGGIQAHRPDLLDGVGIVVGVDRFMSEARALTNFTGNAVATILVGKWTNSVDLNRVRFVLDGNDKFDYTSMVGHGEEPEDLADIGHGTLNPADRLQPTPYPVVPTGGAHLPDDRKS
jgi:aerobic C4-dicarboxylate transport protein